MKFKSLSLFVLVTLLVVGGFFFKVDVALASCDPKGGAASAIDPTVNISQPLGTYDDPSSISLVISGQGGYFCSGSEAGGMGWDEVNTNVIYSITDASNQVMYSGNWQTTPTCTVPICSQRQININVSVPVSSWPAGTYTVQVQATLDSVAEPALTGSDSSNFTITRPAPMTGTLTPASSSCTIPVGQSSCTKTLTWTTTNPVGVSAVTNNGTATPTSPSGNNSSANFTVPFTGSIGDTSSTTTFYLYNSSQLLNQAIVTTDCTPGASWNGDTCEEPVAPSATLTAFNALIPVGASNTLGTYKCRVFNASSGYEVTATNNNRSITTSLCNNTNRTTTVNHGTTIFFVYSAGVELAQYTMTASCDTGSTWNGTICADTIPVNGVCSATHYNCTTGTSANNAENTYEWSWSCDGSGGGTNAQCSQTIPAPTSINASCPAPGTSASISWSLPSGYTQSYFRIRDVTAGGGDIWAYRIPESVSDTGTATTVPTIAGHTYEAWVHTRISPVSYSQSISRTFSCNSAPSGWIVPLYSQCTIPNNQSTCTTDNISWETTNPLAGVTSAVTSATATPSSASGNSGARTFVVPFGSNWLTLYHNEVEIEQARVDASCLFGASDFVSGVCRDRPSISASAGTNGSISPSGMTDVTYGSSGHGYTITPRSGYTVANVLVNGASVGAVSSYTFNNVTSDQTISATFSPSSCPNGAINPPTCTECVPGSIIDENGQCTPVTVSCTANPTSHNVAPGANIPFTFTTETNSGATQSRLLDNNQSPLPSPGSPMPWQAGSQINYNAPNSVGSYNYYIGVRNSTTTTATNNCGPITVNTSCPDGSTWNGSSCAANLIPSGTISASACVITGGQQSCSSTVTWNTGEPTLGPIEVTRNNTPPGPNISYATSGTTTSTIRRNENTTFYLYQNIGGVPTILAQASVTPIELPDNPSPMISISDLNPNPANASMSVTGIGVGGSTQDEFPLDCPTGQMPTLPATAHDLQFSRYKIDSGPLQNFDLSTTQAGVNQPALCVPVGTPSSYRSFLHAFNFPVDTSALSNGTHTITVYAQTQAESGQYTQVSDSTTFSVQHATGTLSASPDCIIPAGASYCDVGVSWSTQNLTANPTQVTRNNPNGTHVSWLTSGNITHSITHGATYFFLYHNGAELAQDSVSATCENGSNWNGSICYNMSAQQCTVGIVNVGTTSINAEPGTSGSTSWAWEFTPPIENEGGGTVYFTVGPTSSPTGVTTTYHPRSAPGGTNVWNFDVASNVTPGSHTMAVTADIQAAGYSGILNCNSINVVVSALPTMTGTLTPASSSCTIPIGQSSCTKTLTWTTDNPVGVSAVTNNGTATPASQSGNNSSANFTVPFRGAIGATSGSTNFYLYNNAQELAVATVDTLCALGSTWNGTTCTANTLPSGTLSASPCTIPSGQSTCTTTLSVTTANLNSPDSSNTAITRNPNGTCTNCTYAFTNPVTAVVGYTTTTFFLYHNAVELAQDSLTPGVDVICTPGTTWNGTICAGSTDPSGTISATNCTIAIGGSSCNSTVSWTTANLTGGATEITGNNNASPALFVPSPLASGSRSVSIRGGTTTFFLYHNISGTPTILAQTNGSGGVATCTSGSTWNGTICVEGIVPSGTISASPCTIPSGRSVCTTTLSVTTANLNSPDSSNTAITRNPNGTCTNCTYAFTNPVTAVVGYTTTTFFLYHNAVELAQDSLTPGTDVTCESGTAWDGDSCEDIFNPIDGACATPPSGIAYSSAPLGPLCSAGNANPSALSGTGPWSWTCSGIDGGSDAQCEAYQGDIGCAALNANPVSIYTGGSTTLDWSSCATSCIGTAPNDFTGGAPSGSVVVSPTFSTTYSMTCDDKSGSTSSVNVVVKKRPAFIEN